MILCSNSLAVVPLNSPQVRVDGVRTTKCQECGQRVKIYIHGDGLSYRVSNHRLPPGEPLLCENEWIAS